MFGDDGKGSCPRAESENALARIQSELNFVLLGRHMKSPQHRHNTGHKRKSTD